ncbi:MAG: hypothetical protein ACLTDF_05250 [Coprococcus sp.]
MKKIYKVIMLTVMFICLFSVTAMSDEEGESVYIYSVNADGKTITINEYNGSSSELDIPSSIDGMQVTAIGDEAFEYCGLLHKYSFLCEKLKWSFCRLCNVNSIIVDESNLFMTVEITVMPS